MVQFSVREGERDGGSLLVLAQLKHLLDPQTILKNCRPLWRKLKKCPLSNVWNARVWLKKTNISTCQTNHVLTGQEKPYCGHFLYLYVTPSNAIFFFSYEQRACYRQPRQARTVSKFTNVFITVATVWPPPSHPPAWSGSSGCGHSGRCPPSLV